MDDKEELTEKQALFLELLMALKYGEHRAMREAGCRHHQY